MEAQLKTIAAGLLATIVAGSLYIIFLIGRSVHRHWRARHQLSEVPTAVTRYIDRLSTGTRQLGVPRSEVKTPKAFGVYLGSFSNPPTADQSRLLSQWDVIVLDPQQDGVIEALSAGSSASHILGRLDVRKLVATADSGSHRDEVVRAIYVLTQTMVNHLKHPQDVQSKFTGVLLADCSAYFQPVVLNEVVKFINNLGLDVWMEFGPPEYLGERQCREIDWTSIRGVVYRNGAIRSDGDRCNYFQMEKMRTVMRVVAAQKPIGDSTIAMWETIDNGIEIKHDVLHRSYKWYNYNSAMSWIGPQAALTDARTATAETVVHEPIGALMWMKNEQTLASHDIWRQNENITIGSTGNSNIYDTLELFVPGLKEKLALVAPALQPETDGELTSIDELQLSSPNEPLMTNPFSMSSDGEDYTGLGCFQLGLDLTPQDIKDLLQAQRQVRELKLLDPIKPEQLRRMAAELQFLQDAQKDSSKVAGELHDLLITCDGTTNDRIRIYSGLHSGFRTRMETQVWGMYDKAPGYSPLDIYLSGKCEVGRTGALLHTFMSSKGYSRYQCLLAEIALSAANNKMSEKWNQLSPRIVSDIEQLTPIEALLWLRRLSTSLNKDCAHLTSQIRACTEHQLIKVPSLAQLRALGSSEYLSGKVSGDELVSARLSFYREQGCWAPEATAAKALFREIDERLPQILMGGDSRTLEQIAEVVQTVIQKGQIDAGIDIFCLAVFCAFRRISIDEIYLEVLDRNPLPNLHTVQAACFAEMYALGARCELFLDMTPKLLGKIITARYREYYTIHQPTRRDEVFTEIPTAYASMDMDLDPQGDNLSIPWYYRITFLGIFAVPALVDITMLTTVGRGLYLTTFMSDIDKTLATTALMVALLVCGGFGSWITSGGTYYLYAMAFPAMSMFVMTRFIAGVAVALVGGLIAMIGIGIVKGFAAGVLFFLYFFFLSTYLMLLSVLSIYQLPGFHFQSGRTVIICCIPILFISPLVTLWVGHDSVIYLCIVGCFVTSLLLGARRVISAWNSWYLSIPTITDGEVFNWFASKQRSPSPEFLKTMASSTVPRKTMLEAVKKERKRAFWSKATTDPFIRKMAEGYDSTLFLLVWYCRYSRTEIPLAYSPTWNLQLKAAVDTIADMQKGIRLHSAFLHWRHTGSDVWCGILYFIIALMDKWTALVTGEALVGLSTASSSEYRLSVGFGLGYYLTGAVMLDAVSQPLWTAVTQRTTEAISSLDSLRDVLKHNQKDRQALYWKNLTKFFFLHVWGGSITMALMWAFEDRQKSTIMYLAYLGAYSGLLFYQYNRIFTGPEAAKALALGSIVGFIVGVLLHVCIPPFTWSSVIGLGSGTWTAAIYSMFMADIGLPSLKSKLEIKEDIKDPRDRATYTCSSLEPYLDLSQTTMAETFDNISSLSPELRFCLDPATHPGSEVKNNILAGAGLQNSLLLKAAFPNADNLLHQVVRLWETGQTAVEFVSAEHLLQKEQRIRAITRLQGDKLQIFVIIGRGVPGQDWSSSIRRNCHAIAEAIVQGTTESTLGLSHDHSLMAELLVVEHRESFELSLPEGVKYQLERNPAECARVANQGRKTFLRHLLLGIDSDLEWDNLPESARSLLVRRCAGKPGFISSDERKWLTRRAGSEKISDICTYIARYNLGVGMSMTVSFFAQRWMEQDSYPDLPILLDSTYEKPFQRLLPPPIAANLPFGEAFKLSFTRLHHSIKTIVKFTLICLVADPEYQRELNYVLRGQPIFFAVPVNLFLNTIWSISKLLQRILIPLVLVHGRENVSELHKATSGWKTVIEKDRIVVESLNGPMTCFHRTLPDNTARLYQYSGNHDQEPEDQSKLIAINTYSDKLVLSRREEYKDKAVVNDLKYEYPQVNGKSSGKLPIQRQCISGERNGEVIQYDDRGYIVSGSAMQGVNPVKFNYAFRKDAKFDDELLSGEYTFPHIRIQVSWCMPPPYRPERLNKWIPYPRVSEATFIQGSDIHHAKWTYDHKFHPTIVTMLNGEEVPTPVMIREDWFHVLDKPTKSSFLHDNPLYFFNSVKTNFVSRMLGMNVKARPIPTSRARTHLWNSWKSSKKIDAVTAVFLDERLLRSDRVLRPYWRKRDFGRLDSAKDYIDAQVDTILARVDIDPDVSSWTPMAYKISDLSSFGKGGDSRINTRTLSTQLQDTDTQLHVLAMDTATWPNEPGGVSSCRRDMINDLNGIRWHILSENANDYGVPKFQIERNVQSLTYLPQWGLDFLNPTHGVFQNVLDSAVVERAQDTRVEDIEKHFLPILTKLVRCARTTNLTRQHIEEATNALVDLNEYFECGRSWNDVWMSDTVKNAWRQLWLSEDVEDAIPASQWWDAELPSLHQLDNALDMWHRYLFIFSIPVPERIPDVFQVSHHFTGATYGVLCKAKRKCALHVWDHCVSFREMTVFLSAAVSFDSTFVNSTLISLGHLSCVLIEHHADVVLPCAEYFNPGWEVELGTAEGALQHRRTFARKIDPVVNGITNMEKYKPIEEIKTKTPTCVMLSHVRYVKDIKTAIMATDLIVNKWGFRDYQLHIYGDMERAPAIASQCQEVIASKGLREHVILKGLGNPSLVLQDAWLFMNSSISEGLPLAMGEAALTGVPVVCTDVGASFCVVTDRATGKRFSEVVAPNDYDSLARAQIRVMALLEQWAPFGEDAPGDIIPKLEFAPTPEEIKAISDRMYAKQDQRRALGMKGRDNVLNSFSSHRYLREHEQMLWLGKYQSHSYIARSAVSSSNSSGLLVKEKALYRASYLDSVPSTPESSYQPIPARAWRTLRDYRRPGSGSRPGSSGTATPV
ncbi:hypothetical protein N7478_011766 [Penicillium angulare]|uniref:uncharacterized protein n=1 Tax=Penicillium angulare TaxID=116970 RepID=UPI00254012BD|nr:uncharacterized protein N7478_011766 [Penicillium angulare]KAJ5261171.1 hypothetical protein N7478_011766 [Penicillium angulare]